MSEKTAQRAVLKKVLHRLRPYWYALILSLVLAALYVVMSLYIPVLAGYAIDCIIGKGHVDFVQMGIHLRNILFCAIAAALAQWVMTQINNRITFHVTQDIRNEIFQHS